MKAFINIFPFFSMIIIFIIYLAGIGFTIWFAVSLIKAQKERNVILKEISTNLYTLYQVRHTLIKQTC